MTIDLTTGRKGMSANATMEKEVAGTRTKKGKRAKAIETEMGKRVNMTIRKQIEINIEIEIGKKIMIGKREEIEATEKGGNIVVVIRREIRTNPEKGTRTKMRRKMTGKRREIEAIGI